MKLKELFDATDISGCVVLCLMEDGVNYQSSDTGYATVTERYCDRNLPKAFEEYAGNVVREVYPSTEYVASDSADEYGRHPVVEIPALRVDVIASPGEDRTEVFYTGGNIWCGICKTEDGWFMGETNSWGGIWKTYSQAWESFPDADCGFVRDVDDRDELKKIWTRIYTEVIAKGEYEKTYCEEWLKNLDADLADM